MTPLRLRVDVCTYQGLRDGVPELLRALRDRGARATFYVAQGPDSSGRAVFNLVRPSFVRQMVRSNAPRTYGLATALYGTVLPAPLIGAGRPALLKRIVDEGHELGVHGWNHRRWQDELDAYAPEKLSSEFRRMCETFETILGRPPRSFAAPAWKVTPALLELEAASGIAFASDCRGARPFRPVFEGRPFDVPQIPVTLPTLDEAVARTEAAAYFGEIRSSLKDGFACLAVHAEAEGRAYRREFRDFLRAVDRPIEPLGSVPLEGLPSSSMSMRPFPGRSYPLCVQGE